MSLPPPAFDLLDGTQLVGWVRGWTVGFRGFANENEAAGAACVAHRTLARRLAQRHGGPAAPIDAEPLSLVQDGDRQVILASGQPIATLVAPGVDSLSGPDSFGFEIEVPQPADERSMRSLAYRTYRTLRTSGARWAMLENRRARKTVPSAIEFLSKLVLAAIAIVFGAVAIATAPRTVTVPIGIVLTTGLAASGVVAVVSRWIAARGKQPVTLRTADDPSEESMRERGWLVLGAASISVLLLALLAPDELALAFAAIGFAGLVVFRLTAAWVGWVPDRTATARGYSEVSVAQEEPTPQRTAWRSDSIRGRPPRRPTDQSRNGTSPRLPSS
jgi:hypothetical protein